jgi:hypothetical protein
MDGSAVNRLRPPSSRLMVISRFSESCKVLSLLSVLTMKVTSLDETLSSWTAVLSAVGAPKFTVLLAVRGPL